MQQRVASLSDVVNTRKEPEVKGEFLLGNASMRAQPTPPERPEPFHRLHMHFTQAVAIFISGVLTPSMVDTRMILSPCTQAGINAVLIRIHKRPWSHGVFDERFNGLLLHMSQQVDAHLTATLHHAKDGWPLFVPCAAPTLTCESGATSFAPLGLHHLRWPCMAGNHRGFVALYLMGPCHGGLFLTIPSRSGVVICCTSRRCTSSSWAICSLDQCNPMTYRHHTHTFRG